jgi:hypothetical protein
LSSGRTLLVRWWTEGRTARSARSDPDPIDSFIFATPGRPGQQTMDGADDDDGGTDYDLLLQPFLAPTATTTTAVPTGGATTAIYQRPNRCLLRELLASSPSKPSIFQISGPYALDVLFNRAAMTPVGDSILFLDGDHHCHDFPLYLNHRQQQQNHQLQQATTNHLPPPHQYQYSKRSLQRLQIVRVATPHELARHILSIGTTTNNNDNNDDDDDGSNNNNNWNGRNGNSINIGFIGVALSEAFWLMDWTARNTICTCAD